MSCLYVTCQAHHTYRHPLMLPLLVPLRGMVPNDLPGLLIISLLNCLHQRLPSLKARQTLGPAVLLAHSLADANGAAPKAMLSPAALYFANSILMRNHLLVTLLHPPLSYLLLGKHRPM